MIPAWVIIVIVVFGLMLLMFKTMSQVYIISLIRDHFFYAFVIVILAFMAISFTRLYSIYDMNLSSYEGVASALKVYMFWLKGVVANFADITGYAIKQDWINSTAGVK
ncbi:hypothetical protein COU60_02845 [Candidatus Pacearchaeota archaeon CG10_big_fil_rev_8_21_14_0_10_34_76]|nr:MAG: hypothetical protein COU60_02845 [Candidatus Pacearchaeota archaeon CG10_big_fil_rev_8_21_14_0_10_34_76]